MAQQVSSENSRLNISWRQYILVKEGRLRKASTQEVNVRLMLKLWKYFPLLMLPSMTFLWSCSQNISHSCQSCVTWQLSQQQMPGKYPDASSDNSLVKKDSYTQVAIRITGGLWKCINSECFSRPLTQILKC
jgi:hypothetical protein